jgi:UDP-MurNAc hydroxylase
MTIQFLGHAGFLVECGGDSILCDPWFSPYGAYAASWFPFPANDAIEFERIERATHLYISHWHEDHLDEWFLHTRSELFKRSVIVVIPKFQYPRLKEVIAQCGYTNILEIEDEYVTSNGTHIYIQRDENPLYSDSSITIGSGDFVFVNSNDCKLTIGQEEEILKRFGAVTIYAAQFSGATFHPTCYDYPDEKKIEMSRTRREAKYQRIVSSIERLKASAYIPSAGPACFLSDDLFHLNLNSATVFSTNSDFYDWLKKNVNRSWRFAEMLPGESIDANALFERQPSFHYESEPYLRKYAENRKNEIAERLTQFDFPLDDLLNATKKHFQSKLDDVPALAKKANVLLEFRVGVNSFYVDTFNRIISDIEPDVKNVQKYRIELSEFWMRAILGKKIRWEDLILSFRFKISRSPDVYNEAFIAFLQLDTTEEREDYIRHLDLLALRDRERIRRECDGRTIEYDRYCPHNCEDLTHAKIEDGVLTCPRHFWRFSLEDGHGLNNPGSIHLRHV